MRVLLQRVKEAKVEIGGVLFSSIGPGLLAFVGVHQNDKQEQIDYLVKKIANLRIFSDEGGKMNLSLKEVGGSILIVSQFTLYGRCQSGRRPDFFESAPPVHAIPLYEAFIEQMKAEIAVVETGQFGADMQVSLTNDGPVTLLLEHS